MSSLPLANLIEIERGLTTSSTAIYSIYHRSCSSGSEALYYGLNAVSNNLIMVDRKIKNPNGLILERQAQANHLLQREIANAFLFHK